MNVITRTAVSGVKVNDVNDRISENKSEFVPILPSTRNIAYKRMLSMLGFDVELPEESSKEEDSKKFNMTDYVVSTL